jgi:hypothetical protein
MQDDRPPKVAHISAETSAHADLDKVARWLIACQLNPIRFDADDLPALGQRSRLMLAIRLTARRAVLCTLRLLEDVDAGGCLLAGQLRFVAHPTGSDIRVSFDGRTETAMRSGLVSRGVDHAVRQLLDVIAQSIERPTAVAHPAT